MFQREISRVEGGMLAPISNLTPGLQKAQVNHGIREVRVYSLKNFVVPNLFIAIFSDWKSHNNTVKVVIYNKYYMTVFFI